jgi:hypothetical protein
VLWKLGITPAMFPGTVYTARSIVTWTDHRGLKWPRWLRPSRAKMSLYRMKLRMKAGLQELRQRGLD